MRASLTAVFLSLATIAWAQRPPTPPTDLALRPAAAPVPALKYRFAIDRTDQVAGNAAIFYLRAVVMTRQALTVMAVQALAQDQTRPPERGVADLRREPAVQAQAHYQTLPRVEDDINKLNRRPIAELPRDEARELLAPFLLALHEVELGALRRDCDWQFEGRTEGFSMQVPEIHEFRLSVRLIALRVRLAVLDGKTDEAIHWLQVGMTLAKHIGEGPTAIQHLVGQSTMLELAPSLQDLIEAPGTPSLYWALATMPRPWIDPAPTFSWEQRILECEIPSLREADGPAWSLERARLVGDEVLRVLTLTGDPSFAPTSRGTAQSPPTVAELPSRLTLAAMVARAYPTARERLIAAGRTAAEVDAMPTLQVVLIDGGRLVRQVRDDCSKWYGLPYWQSYGQPDEVLRKAFADKQSNPVLFLYSLLYPALNSVRVAQVRVDRQYAAFQAIEAIRLHAAGHGGELPASLDAITDAPVPIDPATGKPFGYVLQPGSAVLSAPIIPGMAGAPPEIYSIQATLKLAR